MKPNLFQIKIVFLAACTFLGLSIPLVTNAQLTSGNNFIKGRYIEVGVAPNGTYGTSINAPSGYHSRSHISSGSMGLLGFVADPDQDGWTIGTPAYFGDYFLPASPYQAWGITINSSHYFIDREATGGTTFPIGVTGGNVGNIIIGSQRHAIWQGDIGNLRIKKDIYFDTNSLYFVANITLRNRGVVDLSDVHYLQMVNPDNDAGHTSGTNLSTKDTIKFQNPNIDNKTLVIARGAATNSYLGLGSKDCRAKVFKYNSPWSFSPSAKSVYDGTSGSYAYSGGTPSGNRCIGIVFNLDTLKGGDSTTFAYTYILKENDIDSAFIEIKPNWKYNGITYNSGDTIRACSGSVLPITIENGGSYTWNDWTPVAGLSTTSGTSNSITVSDTLRTYRAIGVNSASVCVTVLDTLYLTIAPNLLPDTPVVAANINYCHSDVTSAIAATGTSLKWYTVPTGGTFVSSVTPSSATPSITNYYVTQTNATTGCESPRKMVRVAINPKPDSVLISNLTPLTFCVGDSVNLIANTKIFNGFGTTAYLQGSSASGTPYICDCPNGSVVTGYQGNSGGLLDRFTLICKPINRFGVLGSATTLTSVNGIASGPNAYGPYTFASTGMMVGLNARNEVWSGGYFGEVTAFGQSQSYITGLGNNSLSPLTLSPVSSLNPSTSLGNIFTPNGTVASGMFAYPTLYSSGVSLRYTPIGAYKYSYSWSSAPATDTNSSITVKTSGSYSFTVTNSFGCSATSPTVNITVNPIPTIGGTLDACAGSTSTLTGSATAHATTPWTSSNTSIATVSSAGVVTGVSAGTVTITYRNTNNCTQTATFTVNPTPSIIGASSINLGGTTTLLGSGTAHATTPWASSNPRVATVSSTGVVTAVGLGTTIITFKNTTNCEARFFLNVNAPNPTGTCAFTQIGSGFQHSLGVKADSSLWAWGFNSLGQLGDGTATTRTTPIRIGTLNNWKLVRGGRFYTVSLNHSGKILAWGDNTYGQLGDGTTTNKSTPTLIGTDSNWSLIEAGFHHTIAIKNNGSLWAWGWNTHGQLGDGTTTDKTSPIRIGTDSNWKSIATGAFHSVALKKDGSIWAWGYNVNGEIGDGTTTYRDVPTRIGTDSNWVSVYAGFNYSMAIRSDGSLWAWGWNGYSQLGDGTMTSRFTPTRIGTDSNWAKAEGADIHTVAIKSNGSQWAWGDNSYGQLGDGTTISKSTPNRVGLDSNWILNQTFANTTLAIKNDGQLFGWGQNTSNQIGDGTTTNRNAPQIINPTPIISGTLSACVGFSSTLTATTPPHATTPWTSSNTAVASVSSTGIVTGISAGSVTITYRNTNDCIATATFTINPLPAAPATSTTVTYCHDASATALSASGTSIKWYSSASGGTSSTTAPSVSTTTPSITTHYVTQTNSFGCESIPRTAINVVINPKPVAVTAIPASATTFCLGDSVILNASSSVFSGFGSTPFFNSTGVSGATFTCDCPNGQVAVGYEGRTGSWMDQFQLICKPLSRLGILSTSTSLTTSNGTSMGGGYNGPYLFTGTNMLVGLNVKSWGGVLK